MENENENSATNCKNRESIGGCLLVFRVTVNVQDRAMLRRASSILGDTCEIPSMSSFNGFNTEHADPLVCSCYNNTVIGHQQLLHSIGVSMNPRYVEWKISSVHGAHK